MTDLLTLEDLTLWMRLGITAEERQAEQRVLVSVTMPFDSSKAGRSDELSDTINYADVAAALRSLASIERNTVERLAEDIAAMLLSRFPLPSVMVTVKKFPLPDCKQISLTIERGRITGN